MNPNDFEHFYSELSRFDQYLGMQLKIHQPGRIDYSLTVDEHHLSAPGACHGGVIAAMMDALLGLTALSWAVTREQLCVTVEFKINYLAPAHQGDRLQGSGTIDFTGSKLVVTSGRIDNLTTERQAAKGLGTFALYPLARRAHLAERFQAWQAQRR